MLYTDKLEQSGLDHELRKSKFPTNEGIVTFKFKSLGIKTNKGKSIGSVKVNLKRMGINDFISNDTLKYISKITECRKSMEPWEIKQFSDDGTFTCFKNLSILNRIRAWWINRDFEDRANAYKEYFSEANQQIRLDAQQPWNRK